ncbi:efflux transporter outer membrane subunit [Massilia horti]|uniref:Efflux transporter outer membrane subunit n=1 Tax=Massilia horti TaxID=2562153 RepID=A0A4Y9T3W1_9BURK|nr:efflux transporter outer membrane subunit [Massilia horti]TFW32230.1 efflux transporter outer membrane subunit [Massilia horti]
MFAVAGLLALSGCAVGPDFQLPAAPTVQRYTDSPLPAQTASAPVDAGAAQHFAQGQDVPADWWKLFGSEPLNELVNAALQANPDLKASEAALRATRENAAAQRGAYLPSVDAQLTPTRQKVGDTLASPLASDSNLYTLHTAQLNIGYVVDVFGGTRRQVEGANAQAEVARHQRDAAWLTLTSNVVAAAIQEAALRAQIKSMNEQVALAYKQLEAVRRQRAAGQIGTVDVAAQAAAVAQIEAGLPPLEKQLARQRDLLAVLAGRLPSEQVTQRFEFATLRLPVELPLSLPARLVEQRPDVRAAEAQLHAASAQIGVAKAARLPNITLSATLGSSALDVGSLFKTGTGFWSIGADLVQPLSKGSALMHQQRAAQAQYDQAAALYRSAVLVAFQDVASALHAIDADARSLRIAHDAERAARRSLDIASKQLDLGMIAYPALWQAEQGYQQASIALVQAQAARYADTVALFQGLGGGWWNREDDRGAGD